MGLSFSSKRHSGIADGNDSIYNRYKEIIGKFHLTPSETYEWFSKKVIKIKG